MPPPTPPTSPVGTTATGPQGARPERRREASAPEWEHPRRLEAYPAIRARRLGELSVSPILIAFVALLLAAAVLFALPGLLGFGGPGGPGGPAATPTPTRPAATTQPSVAPTPVPAPTATVYLVQPGDTMSKIATRFGIPLQVLIDANAENIPDPDRLDIGDEVIIPAARPTEIPGELPGSS